MPASSTAKPKKPFLRRAVRRLKRTLGGGKSPAPAPDRSRKSPAPRPDKSRKSPAPASDKSSGPRPRPFQPDPQLRCLVCGSDKLTGQTIERPGTGRVARRRAGRIRNLVICQQCRYVSSPDASHDYAAAASTQGLSGGLAERCATVDTPGRETGMAKLGLEVLQRPNASVLVYGAGQSLDVHHIAKLPRSGRVAIGDLVKLRDDAEFIDINEHSSDPFDIVVASEVLEHFPDPWQNFRNLFSYVKDDGIVVAGTNIRDHGSLNTVIYLWCRGHVSYFSPESLRIIARAEGMHLDFRFPLRATKYRRKCKRYVIFSRSATVMEAVSDWFGSEVYAPSEPLKSVRKTRAQVTLPSGTILPNVAKKPARTSNRQQ
jgi:SAM-dependent methyltransferase